MRWKKDFFLVPPSGATTSTNSGFAVLAAALPVEVDEVPVALIGGSPPSLEAVVAGAFFSALLAAPLEDVSSTNSGLLSPFFTTRFFAGEVEVEVEEPSLEEAFASF